jgi:hypothetical protein
MGICLIIFFSFAVSNAIAQLLSSCLIAEAKDQSPELAQPAREIFDGSARLMGGQVK